MTMKFVCPCLMGVESLVASELKDLGAENTISENGRVIFDGDFGVMARANIRLRFAERVLILLKRFNATTFDELFEGVKAIDWSAYIGAKDAFPVKGSAVKSQLRSVPDCQSIIKKAIVDKLREKYNISHFEETGDKYQIQFLILKNTVSIMIDTTGLPLYKRGYRKASGLAPIRETLAASMIKLAHIRMNSTLIDPFCGSGTIPIEGAMYALNIAPGLYRHFISETWSLIDSKLFKEERYRASTKIRRDVQFHAYGFDTDSEVLTIAQSNAQRAGVFSRISFEKRDVKDFKSVSDDLSVVCNPPYGERLLDIKKSRDIYRIMGERFLHRRGFNYYIISADDEFEKYFGRQSDKKRKLYNGMLKCYLYMYFK